MQELALTFLMSVLSLVGLNRSPALMLEGWKVSKSWEISGDASVLEATTTQFTEQCKNKENHYILFPQVIHGVHQIYLDGKIVKQSGDPTFQVSSPFYAQTFLSCAEYAGASELMWRVTSYSRFFSRVRTPPTVVESVALPTFLNLSTNIIAGGALIVLAIFSLMIFSGRVSNELTYSVVLGSLISALYFLNAVNSYIGIPLSMILSHKIADVGIWIGGGFFLYAFRIDGLLNKWIFRFYAFSTLIGSLIMIFGRTGDDVQFGTMIPMIPCMLSCLNIAGSLMISLVRYGNSRSYYLKFISISLFAIFGTNDILHIVGLIDGYVLLSVGIVFAVLGLSVAVTQEIENTYRERDNLLKTLEDKVAEKTRDLQQTLHSLQDAQAELIHSAKLASLGTLSAGIAHEINNSINYVSGALVPLERKVMASASDSDKVLFTKLFAAIKEGTTLTVEIVRSLRNFTGLNQAAAKEITINEVFSSVLTILKSKLSGIQVTLEVENDLRFYGNLVGLNQMLMNLITNAIDAMPRENPQLRLRAYGSGNQVAFEVIDNGAGISSDVQKKIFDPFFTTKDVGKGTGLGLHIVTKEVERHRGKISLQSELGKGTTFTITLPKTSIPDQEAA